MKSTFLPHLAVLSALLLGFTACDRASKEAAQRPVPTAEDIRIGRHAISINEVSLLVRSGAAKEALDAVVRRHIPEPLSAEEQLQFQTFGKPELMAALVDPQNILTPAQKDAYDESKGRRNAEKEQLANGNISRQQQVARTETDKMWAASAAEQAEVARRERLNREAAYEAERSRAEREAREYEQRRSTEDKWRLMEAQNSYHRPYNTPVPNRRYQRPDTRPKLRTDIPTP
jgi:hypothetical protein